MTAQDLHGLLTADEAAVLLNVRPKRVREAARVGLLPVVKFGRQLRFDPTALREWIAAGGTPRTIRRHPAPRCRDDEGSDAG